MIKIALATEDALSEKVAEKIINNFGNKYYIYQFLRNRGNGYLKKNIKNFNNIAKNHTNLLMITDLDRCECAPTLISNWIGDLILSERFLFRVAVTEVEAWVLSDRVSFSSFLGIDQNIIPPYPDQIMDSKEQLLSLVRKSKNREIKSEILPDKNSTVKVGLGYNEVLCQYVMEMWDPVRAKDNSPSLEKAINHLDRI